MSIQLYFMYIQLYHLIEKILYNDKNKRILTKLLYIITDKM